MSTAVATPGQSQPTPIVRWDGTDTLNVSADVLNLFATISSPIPIVDSIISPVLLGIKEICISVKEVEENREAAEDLAKKILRMVVRIVNTMHAANIVPSMDSPFTRTMIELNSSLSEILTKIRSCQRAQEKWWRSAAQRKKIKDILDAGKADLESARSQAQFELIIGLYATSSSSSAPAPVPASASPLPSPQPAQQQQHRALPQQPQSYLSTGQPFQQDSQFSSALQHTPQTSTSQLAPAPSQPQQWSPPNAEDDELRQHNNFLQQNKRYDRETVQHGYESADLHQNYMHQAARRRLQQQAELQADREKYGLQ